MKTKIFNLAFLIGALSLAVLPVLVLPACTTTQQRDAYNTIYSLERATMAAYDAYLTGVITGNVKTNDLPQVSQAFNAFQASMLLALDGVQYNTNALAPPSLVMEATDLLKLIRIIEITQGKGK